MITNYDHEKIFKPIELFIPFEDLDRIKDKVWQNAEESLADEVTGGVAYTFSEAVKEKFPEQVKNIGKAFDLRTNIMNKLHNILFFEEKPEDEAQYARILGLFNRKRAYLWINTQYIVTPANFDAYKVFVPKSNGSGALGEVLSPLIGTPLMGHTQTVF